MLDLRERLFHFIYFFTEMKILYLFYVLLYLRYLLRVSTTGTCVCTKCHRYVYIYFYNLAFPIIGNSANTAAVIASFSPVILGSLDFLNRLILETKCCNLPFSRKVGINCIILGAYGLLNGSDSSPTDMGGASSGALPTIPMRSKVRSAFFNVSNEQLS